MAVPISLLKAALAKTPDNILLRLTLVRRCVDEDQTAEAVNLAIELEASDVTSESDRAMLAQLWDRAGLSDLGNSYRAQTAPEPPASPTTPHHTPQTPPTDARTDATLGLRLVGGTEQAKESSQLVDAPSGTVVDFTSVGGLEEVKKDIRRRIILPFAQPSLVARFRKQAGGGVLLYGPPGCGKTMLARATAGERGAQFMHAPLSEILDPYSGISERRLTALFEKARSNTPTILFFDEIEALAAKRSNATASHVSQLVSHFLYELDGVDTDNKGVLVLAATNTPWAMDAAFLRPGRFDRMFFVPPPDNTARKNIFDLELSDRPIDASVKSEELARQTAGFSGADIKAVVESATDRAIDKTLELGKECPIKQQMLHQAIIQNHSAVGDWLSTAKDYATYANESGRYDDVLSFIDKYWKKK